QPLQPHGEPGGHEAQRGVLHHGPRVGTAGVKLISWNVNGIRAAWKKGLPEFGGAGNPDGPRLQEPKIQREQLTPGIKALPGYRSHWSMAEKKGYSGVATYTRPEPLAVATNFGSPALDTEGRVLTTENPAFHPFKRYLPKTE